MINNNIFNVGYRKSRKEHECEFCKETIPKGIKYFYMDYKDGDKMYTFKAHRECKEFFENRFCDPCVQAYRVCDGGCDLYSALFVREIERALGKDLYRSLQRLVKSSFKIIGCYLYVL